MPTDNTVSFAKGVTEQLKQSKSLGEISDHSQNMLKELKSTQKSFEMLQIELAPQREILDAAVKDNSYLKDVVDQLDGLVKLDGAARKDQKIGLARLAQIRKDLDGNKEISDESRAILDRYMQRIDEGLTKQSNILNSIKKAAYENIDKITGGIAYALGESPLGMMLSGFLSTKIKEIFERRREAKNQKANLAKLKAIEAATKGVEKAVKGSKPTRLDAAQAAPTRTTARGAPVRRKAGIGARMTMIMVAGMIRLFSMATSAVTGLVSAVSLISGGIQLAWTALSGFASFIWDMIKNLGSALARLIPGFSGDKTTAGGKASKTTKPGGKATQMSKTGSVVKKGAGKALSIAGRGAALLGPAAAVAGAGYAGWEIGSWLNDELNSLVKNATGGKSQSLGEWIYDKTHDDKTQNLVAATSENVKAVNGAKSGALVQSQRELEAMRHPTAEGAGGSSSTVVQTSQTTNQVIAPRIDPSNHDPSFLKASLAGAT